MANVISIARRGQRFTLFGCIALVCASLVCATLLWAQAAQAAPQFPVLTGRVVDQANMLTSAAEAQIAELSQAHEAATSNQVVVAVLPDLQGYSIEQFGYQLGRHWGIGQQDKNNGVLLLVAKAERKVRIEVGYGLEGVLTDAIAANISEQKRGGRQRSCRRPAKPSG